MDELNDKKKASSDHSDDSKNEGKKKLDGKMGFQLPGFPKVDFTFSECEFSVNVNINVPVSIHCDSDKKSVIEDVELERYFADVCSEDDAKQAALDNLKQYIEDKQTLKGFVEFLGVCTNTLSLTNRIKNGLLNSGVIDGVVVKKADFIDSVLAFAPKLTTGGNIKSVRAAISRSLNES